jgi:sirohydrochlorin cobaltochelatase
VDDSFSDAALVLIGHGSTVSRDSAGPVYQHAAELRARRLFAEVRETFWKQDPPIAEVLASLRVRRVFAVPVFISEGYFTEEMIPRELRLARSVSGAFVRIRQDGDQTLCYCAPVGTHPSMTRVILERARAVVERSPFPRQPKLDEIALFVAGHGTDRNENSRQSIERHVARIRSVASYSEVQAVFMEEEPRIERVYDLTRLKYLVVVPFLISDGLHGAQDIPVMLGEPETLVRKRLQAGQTGWRNPTEKRGKLVWYARAAGTEPHLAEVILERVREAAATSPATPPTLVLAPAAISPRP